LGRYSALGYFYSPELSKNRPYKAAIFICSVIFSMVSALGKETIRLMQLLSGSQQAGWL